MKIRKSLLEDGKIIPLNMDFIFNGIFNNSKNIIILENFISCYLNIPIEDIRGNLKLQSRELELEGRFYKNKQIDLLLDYKGEKINIELNNNPKKSIIDRNVVYACNIHGRQLEYNDNSYNNICKTLQINLNNKNINNKLKESYFLFERHGEKVLTDKFQIDMIDMELGRKLCYTKDETKLARWCRVLTSSTEEEFYKSLGDDLMELEAKDKLIDEMEKYISDEPAVALYSAYTREELERNSILNDEREEARAEGLAEGRAEGLAEGRTEGINETKRETAINLVKNGISEEIIISSLNITKEELKEFLK